MKTLITLIISIAITTTAWADVVARYSFTADANSSVGSSHGQLKGSAKIDNGAVVLDGTGWVEINAAKVTKQKCASVETWFKLQPNSNWVRVFDFGNTNAEGMGANCWYFTPKYPQGSRTTFSNTDPGYRYEETIDNKPLPIDTDTHIAVIFNSDVNDAKLYVNGELIGERKLTVKLSDIGTGHLYLGKSSYNSDRPMKGSISEFRIYDSPLSAMQILLNSQLGPDKMISSPITAAKPNNASAIKGSSETFTWTLDENVTAEYYEVAFAAEKDALKHTNKLPDPIRTEKPELNNMNFSPNTDYYWRVDTIDDKGNRHLGPILKFKTANP